MSVNERIKFLVDKLENENQRQFALKAGVTPTVIGSFMPPKKEGDRVSKPSYEALSKIMSAYPNINANWLLTGKGEPFKNGRELEEKSNVQVFTSGTEKKHELQQIPLYDVTAAAGLTSIYNSTNNILDYLSIPNLPRCDGAIYLKGDSMYPLLKHGDMVVFQRLEDIPDDIDFGEMYVVDMSTPHRERIVVKYVQKSELGPDHIKLVSYNKNHEDKDVPLKKVRAMAAVKASIRLT